MSNIRLPQISEFLIDPIRVALSPSELDPLVRKTAVLAVAKLHEVSPEQVIDHGLVDILLRDMLTDSSPMVVSNTVMSLGEWFYTRFECSFFTRFECGFTLVSSVVLGLMSKRSPRPLFIIDSSIVQSLLSALNECNEWGQVYILGKLIRV